MKITYYLQECNNFEKKVKDKFCNFISLKLLINQSEDDFRFTKTFALNLDLIMVNYPFLTTFLAILI